MKKSILIVIIFAVIIIGIILAVVLINKPNSSSDEFIYKGVWMPSFGSSVIIPEEELPENLLPEGYDLSVLEPVLADFDKAEEAGINIFAFQMGYYANEQGELSLFPGEKEFFANFIDEAHERGFKIWLNPEIIYLREVDGPSSMRIMPDELIENTDLLENFENAIVETAKFAEEHDVEMFSPSSEMYANLDFEKPTRDNSKQVIINVKPRIDEVYSGKICLKGEWPGDDFIPYYSCFGPTIRLPESESEINDLINHLEQEANKNVEIIIAEIFESSGSQATQAETKQNFERTLEAVKGRVSGVFILDSGRTYRQIFPDSFEATIKEFYEKY